MPRARGAWVALFFDTIFVVALREVALAACRDLTIFSTLSFFLATARTGALFDATVFFMVLALVLAFLVTDFLDVPFLAVSFLPVDFLAVPFLAVDFLAVPFLAVDFLETAFGFAEEDFFVRVARTFLLGAVFFLAVPRFVPTLAFARVAN